MEWRNYSWKELSIQNVFISLGIIPFVWCVLVPPHVRYYPFPYWLEGTQCSFYTPNMWFAALLKFFPSDYVKYYSLH